MKEKINQIKFAFSKKQFHLWNSISKKQPMFSSIIIISVIIISVVIIIDGQTGWHLI